MVNLVIFLVVFVAIPFGVIIYIMSGLKTASEWNSLRNGEKVEGGNISKPSV